MKKWIPLTLCLLSICVAKAQVKIAPEAGLNLSNYIFKSEPSSISNGTLDTKLKVGFRAGTVTDIIINKISYIQVGIYYVRNGFTIYTNSTGWNVNTLQIPLTYLYKFGSRGKNRPFVGGGVYLDKNFSGTNKFLAYGASAPLKIGKSEGDLLKPTDLGFAVNAGLETKKRLFFRLYYQRDLTNLEPYAPTKSSITNYNIGVTAGCWLLYRHP